MAGFRGSRYDPVANTLPGQYHSALFRSSGFKEDL